MQEKTKHYIIVTANIHPVGGMQAYVAGKVDFLNREGWKVTVLFPGANVGQCAFPQLDDYVGGGVRGMGIQPFKWPFGSHRVLLDELCEIVGDVSSAEEIIVESNDDPTAQWGELLAERLGAQHICLLCNEVFRGPYKTYDKFFDFYEFKLLRGELAGIHKDSLPRLFEGHTDIPEDMNKVFIAAPCDTVQDSGDTESVYAIPEADWTICHIGRVEKDYVGPAIEGIAEFATEHDDKAINVVFVGDIACRKGQIESRLVPLNNVSIIEMGDLVPIPRCLYERVDVVVASSGCALASAHEGVYTIVADAGNDMANGALGYDTTSFLFHDEDTPQMDYSTALKRVLVDRAYDELILNLPPPKADSDVHYRAQIEMARSADPRNVYFGERLLCRGGESLMRSAKCAYIAIEMLVRRWWRA